MSSRPCKSEKEMVCEQCKKKIHTFQYNLDEYAYKRGERYFCSWTCMRKWDKENPKAQPDKPMHWKRVAGIKWVALGRHGIFTIIKDKKQYRATYKSSVYNENRKLKKAATLNDIKGICEDNEYWEW